MLRFNRVWHFGEVISSRIESRFSLYRADGKQRVWRRVGWAVCWCQHVDRVAHSGGGGYGMGRCMLWTKNTGAFLLMVFWMHRDTVKRSWGPLFVPFIHDHHLMWQHDNARPHVARICTQFLEAENIPVLAWPANSPDMSPIDHVWDTLDRLLTPQTHYYSK